MNADHPPIIMDKNLVGLDSLMRDGNIILALRDKINRDALSSLLALAEMKMGSIAEGRSVKKRIFNILVECLQNVANHAELIEGRTEVSTILVLAKEQGDYVIITGNPVRKDQVDNVIGKIEDVNGIGHQNVREEYMRMLDKSEYSAKGGAGLGLIDIYKRSGQPLEYDISPINEEYAILTLKVRIGTKDKKEKAEQG